MRNPAIRNRLGWMALLGLCAIGSALLATRDWAGATPLRQSEPRPAAAEHGSTGAGGPMAAASPQCQRSGDHQLPQVVAVDRGHPTHLVVGTLAGEATDPPARRNLSGCLAVADVAPGKVANYGICGLASVASTEDVSGDLAARAAAEAKTPANPDILALPPGLQRDAALTEWANRDRWRFATLAHLPTGADCSIGQAGAPETAAMAPPWNCHLSNQICHGRKPQDYLLSTTGRPPDPSAWCPDPMSCACKSSDLCHYPQISSLEIDPRNGYAYAVTHANLGTGRGEFGLLTSPDGGRHWMRMGNASALPAENDAALPPDIAAGSRGAQLLTHQLEPKPADGRPLSDDNALDLTRHPLRVKRMGPMSVAWTPCATAHYAQGGVAQLDYHKDPRRRGTLVASVLVEWLSSTGQRVSSVFAAAERDDCQGERALPGALVFRDSGVAAGSW